MKPAFALRLDHDSVTLLSRAADGWVLAGSVALADPALGPALTRLRAQGDELAKAQSGGRLATKLILPASQILYTEVDAPGPDRATRRSQIAHALEGRTPYAVDDLVFDWSRNGPTVRVAVVAKMTLAEAEEFAEAHGFNPVSFVAIPEAVQFAGEPFFGQTSKAAAHMPEGETLTRDQDPVKVVDAPLPEDSAACGPAAAETDQPHAETAKDTPAPEAPEATAQTGAAELTEAESEEPATDDAAHDMEIDAEDTGAPLPDGEAEDDTEESAAPADDAFEDNLPDDAAPEVSFEALADIPDASSSEPGESPEDEAAKDSDADETAETDEPDGASGQEAATAGPLEDTSGAALPDDIQPRDLGVTEGLVPDGASELPDIDATASDLPEGLPDALPEDLDGSLGPEPAAAEAEAPFIAVDDLSGLDDPAAEADAPAVPIPAFSSRRPGGTVTPVPSLRAERAETTPAAVGESVLSRVTDGALPDTSADEAAPPPVTGNGKGIRTGLERALLKTLPDARHGTQAQLRARRAAPPGEDKTGPGPGGPFGAMSERRRPNTARLAIGIVAVAVLILVMTAVALWSIWFAALPDTETTTVAEAPAVTAPPEVSEAPAPAPEAIVEVAPTPAPAEPDATQAQTETPDIAPPATGTIWVDPPNVTGLPADNDTTTAGTPSITAALPPSHAEAVTPPALDTATTAADTAPPHQPLPPPFGTTFEFRPDGLIRATPEGVVTPDGITLVAGRPPVAPTPRPAGIAPEAATGEAAPPEAEPETIIAPADAPQPEAALAVPGTDTPPAPGGSAAPEAETAAQPSDAIAAAEAPLPPPVDPAHAALKPRPRPGAIVDATRARAAAAEAEARALAEALASATPQAVASSRLPKQRPKNLIRAVPSPDVEDAVAAAVASSVSVNPAPAATPAPAPATAKPEEIDEPEPTAPAPNIPTTVTVARQATIKNAIDLGDVNLIGVFGSSSNRRALVRMPTGRYVKVKIGDRLDGGQVAAIGDRELSYVKRGRTIVLKIKGDG